MTVRVKICGIARPEDARDAARAGASAIGMILWPGSARGVSVDRASEIAAAIEHRDDVTCVGVFVDQPPAFVKDAIGRAHLDAIQLHGRESVAAYDFGVPILKAFGVAAKWDDRVLSDLPPNAFPLLDATDGSRTGGIGTSIDWRLAAGAASQRRIVLAGGLTPENVGHAIAIARPFAVDVSSGVEVSPGVKDARRMREFIEAVEAVSGAVPRRLFE